jgi:hypoxanthine phosphoribosyltransferase
MSRLLLRRKTISDDDYEEIATRFAGRLAGFAPSLVIYLEQGGRELGLALARELHIQAVGLDLSYSMSRFIQRLPVFARVLAWPVKEILYKSTLPKLNEGVGQIPDASHVRILLVDDSASTGRSLRLGLNVLRDAGVSRQRIRVLVIRCGKRARSTVDLFEFGEPVLFRRG